MRVPTSPLLLTSVYPGLSLLLPASYLLPSPSTDTSCKAPGSTVLTASSPTGSAFLVSCAQRSPPPREYSPRSGWLPSLAEASPLSLLPGQGGKGGCWRQGAAWGGGSRWVGEDGPSVVEAKEVWSGPPPSRSLGLSAFQFLSPGKVGAWASGGPVHRTCCSPPPVKLNWPPGCLPQAPT